MLVLEHNNGSAINAAAANGLPAGNANRTYQFMIENTAGSYKALGIAVNLKDVPYTYSNTTTQSQGFALLGYFDPGRTATAGMPNGILGQAYSFTGQHSSMPSLGEYDEIVASEVGMLVCSSGKIYNLPNDDGSTLPRQVDNIQPIDAQPMTRLCASYKDKTVLGVISSIEDASGRVDYGVTCWRGNLASDADGRRRIRVASIGEGAIWVTNEHGNVSNDDYITSSNTRGYGTRQDDDIMHSYTVAKATMDCSFDAALAHEYKTRDLGDGLYASYIAVTFHCG